MDELEKYVVFRIEERQLALPLNAVERVIRAVEITPLPDAPEPVLGVINVRGQMVPVIDTRKWCSLPETGIDPGNQFIIANTAKRTVALLVDEVIDIIERPDKEVATAEEIFSGMKYINGVVKFNGNIILVYDLDLFLSIKEDKVLEEAMG